MIMQGTQAWREDKCGCVSASCFADVLAKGQGKTRAAYMRRVVAERLTGKPIETFRNGHTDRGTEQEPLAKMAYEARFGEPVLNVGFIRHQKHPRVGCSPDGLVGVDGGVECKSVIATTQLDTWLGGDFPTEHRAQIQGNLWVTGREWWDFVSFCPDYVAERAHLRLYRFRIYRDEAYIANLEREVLAFDQEAEKMYLRMCAMSMSLEEQLRASIEAVPA